jgi:hypothetical protein
MLTTSCVQDQHRGAAELKSGHRCGLCARANHFMATPIILGLGAIAAAVTGRHLVRTGVLRLGGSNAAEQWVKGGFRQKMDRNEAIAILGLKYAVNSIHPGLHLTMSFWTEIRQQYD